MKIKRLHKYIKRLSQNKLTVLLVLATCMLSGCLTTEPHPHIKLIDMLNTKVDKLADEQKTTKKPSRDQIYPKHERTQKKLTEGQKELIILLMEYMENKNGR